MLDRLPDPRDIEERTPADRDRVADLVRLAAILLVVFGHWLVTAVLYRDGELVADQALRYVPEARVLTWIFQVMPLFFFIGGHLNAGSWERARAEGHSWARWLRRRSRRLLTPLVPVLVLWTVLPPVLQVLPVRNDLTARAAEAALLPLWFLVVYVVVIAFVPVTRALHRRAGLLVPAAAIVLTGITDVLTRADVPVVGYLAYVTMWGGVHQLGYWWQDRRLPRPPAALAIAAAGLLTAIALVAWFGYPFSMVAVRGAEQQNTDPPSLALWAFSIAQIAVVVAARQPLRRWLERPRVWAPVVLLGSVTLTLFLWHMTAMVLVGIAVHPTRLWPRLERIGPTWWALRPLWMVLCAVMLALLTAIFHRFEDQPDPVPRDSALRAALGLGAFVAGMIWIMLHGIYDPELATNVRLIPVVLVVVGLGLLGALRPRRQLEERSEDPDRV